MGRLLLRAAGAIGAAVLLGACLEQKAVQPVPAPAPAPAPVAGRPPMVVYWTISMEGFVDLCGCSPDMPGGWSRLAVLREREPDAIWLDAGGWSHPPENRDPTPEVTARLFREGFRNLRYFAVHVAPQDRAAWETLDPKRQILWLAGGGLDYDAAVPTQPGAGPAPREVLIDVVWLEGQPRLAVLAVGAMEQLPAVRERLARVGQSHGVILLSTLGEEANRALLEEEESIVYLIGPGPEDRGDLAARWSPPLERFGWEVGRVELPAGTATRITTDGSVDKAEGALEIIGATGMWIANIREEGFAERVPVNTGLAPEPAVCGACHASEYEVWKKSGHAGAWDTMVDLHNESRPDCVGCHTVGWNPEALTYDGVDVGCLACHSGDGAAHVANPTGAPLALGSKETCAGCHRPDHSTMFSPRGYWPRVAHGREGPL